MTVNTSSEDYNNSLVLHKYFVNTSLEAYWWGLNRPPAAYNTHLCVNSPPIKKLSGCNKHCEHVSEGHADSKGFGRKDGYFGKSCFYVDLQDYINEGSCICCIWEVSAKTHLSFKHTIQPFATRKTEKVDYFWSLQPY